MLDIDTTWEDYTNMTHWLVFMAPPQAVVDYLKSSFGTTSLPEPAITRGLVIAARAADALDKKKESKFLWKAAFQSIKNDEEHPLITLGVIHSHMCRIDNQAMHRAKSRKYYDRAAEQFRQEWEKTKAIGTEANPLKYVDYLFESEAFDEACAFLKEYLPMMCCKKVFEDRLAANQPRILVSGFELAHLITQIVHTKPELFQVMMDYAEPVQDPYVRVQIYLGCGRGLIPPKYPASLKETLLFSDSFSVNE